MSKTISGRDLKTGGSIYLSLLPFVDKNGKGYGLIYADTIPLQLINNGQVACIRYSYFDFIEFMEDAQKKNGDLPADKANESLLRKIRNEFVTRKELQPLEHEVCMNSELVCLSPIFSKYLK